MAIISVVLVGLLGSLGCEERTVHRNYGASQDMTVNNAFQANYLNVNYYSLRTCLKCHDNRIPPNLGNYKDLAKNIDEVLGEVTGHDMPPSGDGYEPLNACQLLVLNTWINAGMPKVEGPTLGASGNACY